MGSYTVSNLAMIVFFICVAVSQFISAGPVVTLIEAIAALVAAVALLAHK